MARRAVASTVEIREAMKEGTREVGKAGAAMATAATAVAAASGVEGLGEPKAVAVTAQEAGVTASAVADPAEVAVD